MINSGEDVRRLFKFGDAAILELRTDANQTAKEAAPGDLRLLFSVHDGTPVAVLYDYRRPCEGVAPTEFISVKTTRIDCLKLLEDADIDIERTGRAWRGATPTGSVAANSLLAATQNQQTGKEFRENDRLDSPRVAAAPRCKDDCRGSVPCCR